MPQPTSTKPSTQTMTQTSTKSASGVQELIARLRDEGVRSGHEEAERILEQARREAAEMVAAARTEIEALRTATEAKLDADRAATLEALKLAARDTGLELEAAVIAAFERQVKRLVSNVTLDGEFVRKVVLVLAGQAADAYIQDKKIQVLISNLLLQGEQSPEIEEVVREKTLAFASEMLREGVELIPADDEQGGARVRVVGEDLEIDLGTDAIHRLVMRNLLPRFRALLAGAE